MTDKRVLLVPLPVITASDPVSGAIQDLQPASLPHAETERVEERLGRMESKLDLVTKDGTIRLTSMRKQGASSVADAVRRYL